MANPGAKGRRPPSDVESSSDEESSSEEESENEEFYIRFNGSRFAICGCNLAPDRAVYLRPGANMHRKRPHM